MGAAGLTDTWFPLPALAPMVIPPTVPTTEFVTVVDSESVYVKTIEPFAGTRNGPPNTSDPASSTGSAVALPPRVAVPVSKLQLAGPVGVGLSRRPSSVTGALAEFETST